MEHADIEHDTLILTNSQLWTQDLPMVDDLSHMLLLQCETLCLALLETALRRKLHANLKTFLFLP